MKNVLPFADSLGEKPLAGGATLGQRGIALPPGRRFRILFLTHTDDWIGPNISLLELITRLPDRFEPQVALCGFGPLSTALAQRGIPFHRLRRLDKYGLPGLVRLIVRQRIELVYGNSASGVSRNGLLAAKLCGLPFIYHLREMAGTGRWRKVRFLRHADAVIAVSQATARSYQVYLRQPPRIIYNGVSVSQYDLNREECRDRLFQELSVPQAAPVIAHVGNVYQRKGQHLAVEVMREVSARVPEARLILVGRLDRDPEYVEAVRNSIRESGQADRIILAGFREDVPVLLCGADVLLHTAYRDPHPRVVIEAMAAGLPVVAQSVDGVAETVVDGETGFLVAESGTVSELADRLIGLLTDDEVRRRMGNSGRQRAMKCFSSQTTARQVEAVLDQVLK